jgi:hypothetical protein
MGQRPTAWAEGESGSLSQIVFSLTAWAEKVHLIARFTRRDVALAVRRLGRR